MKHKNLDIFVRHSIKATSDSPDEVALQSLFDGMTTLELQSFWMNFTSSRAFSVATTTVPDWKTKQRLNCLEHEVLDYGFQPKEKGTDGKYIVIRSDLEEHIKKYLFKHINDERELRKAYKNQPIFNKIHNLIGVLVLIMIIPFCVCDFLADNKMYPTISNDGVLLFIGLWGLYVSLGLIRLLISYFRSSETKTK
jgi:hypothetical protein